MSGTRERKLNIGCGIYHVKGFINVDKHVTKKMLQEQIKAGNKIAKIEKGSKFVHADVLKLPFRTNSIDYIETIDMIEHLSFRDIARAFAEMRRVLKPGHQLRLVTTDFNAIAQQWVDDVKNTKELQPGRYQDLMESIYGNQRHGGEYHKTPFTPGFLSALLNTTKWSKFKIIAYPRFSPCPKFEANPFPEGAVMRTDTLLVEAIK